MTVDTNESIRSGAAHVDETESLASGHTAPRSLASSQLAREDDAHRPPLKTALAHMTLSMFIQGSSTRVRVGNAHNASELYEFAYDSSEDANQAMVDNGILTRKQIPDTTQPAGVGVVLDEITLEQLEAAGLKRHGASTI